MGPLLRLPLVASAVALVISACGGSGQAGQPGAHPSPSASPSPSIAHLPSQMQFTSLTDLSAGSYTPGPGVLTATGLWTASTKQLLQVTADGRVTAIDLPAPSTPGGWGAGTSAGIAAASDGTIWISQWDRVLSVGPEGRITSYAVLGRPNGRITEGPDHAIWVTELSEDRVARIMSGQVREFPLPAATTRVQCGGRCPFGVASGPDGNLWITESQLAAGDMVGRMTPAGQYANWALPKPGAALNDITAGPDGAMWFGEGRAQLLGRITTSGTISEQAVDLPAHPAGTEVVTSGNGLIWYAASMPPTNIENDPAGVGALLPGGGSHFYEIPGSKGPVLAIVPVAMQNGQVVDVITGDGHVWQGVGS